MCLHIISDFSFLTFLIIKIISKQLTDYNENYLGLESISLAANYKESHLSDSCECGAIDVSRWEVDDACKSNLVS